MKVCVSCESDVEGKPATKVKDDRVISSVRAVKKAVGIAKLNELYVCDTCLEKHITRRKSFEKSLLFSSVLAGIVVILVIGVMVFSGGLNLGSFISALIVGGFILLLPFFRYVPGLQGQQTAKQQQTANAAKATWATAATTATTGIATTTAAQAKATTIPATKFQAPAGSRAGSGIGTAAQQAAATATRKQKRKR